FIYFRLFFLLLLFSASLAPLHLHSFPTRRSSDLDDAQSIYSFRAATVRNILEFPNQFKPPAHIVTLEENYRSTQPILDACNKVRSEEHTSELQSPDHLVCRLLLEKKKKKSN